MDPQPEEAKTRASASLWSTTGRSWEVALDARKAWRTELVNMLDSATVEASEATAARRTAQEALDLQADTVLTVSAEAAVLMKLAVVLDEVAHREHDRQLIADYDDDDEEEEGDDGSDDELAGFDFANSPSRGMSNGDLMRQADEMLYECMLMAAEEPLAVLQRVEDRYGVECRSRDLLRATRDVAAIELDRRETRVAQLSEQVTTANERVVSARRLLATATSWDELKAKDELASDAGGGGTATFFE